MVDARNTAGSNATARLGAYLARAARTPLAPTVAEKAAICLLDSTGLAVLAHAEPTAAAARTLALPVREPVGAARIWANGVHVSPGEAALANGIAAHAHFQDDTDHDSWSHPGSLVPPAISAVGEARDLDVTTVLRALTAGYATINWLGRGEDVSRRLIARGIRTSATLGTIAAAAGCAVALGLDAAAARSAVAIAANITGGTLEPVRCGSDEWRVQNGRAAQGGFLAASLAASGVAGAPDALEGARGFLFALAGADAAPASWASDPDPAIMLEVMAKPFATLGDNMSAVCAALVARGRGLQVDEIAAIEITQWRPYTTYPGTAYRGPFLTNVQTQASTAFAVCAMLMHGELTYEMGDSGRDDPRLAELIARTTIQPHDGTHSESVVTVTLADGRRIQGDAANAPATLIHQDSARAIQVFEERLAEAGHAPGHGEALARRLLAAADGQAPMRLAEFLAALPVVAPIRQGRS